MAGDATVSGGCNGCNLHSQKAAARRKGCIGKVLVRCINTYSFAVMQGASQYALLACCNGLPENSVSFWTSVVVLCGSRSPNFYAAQYCMTKVVIAVNVLLRPPMMPEQLVEKHQQPENIAPAQAAACIDSILFSTRVLDLPEF